jgi:hypothetical protein
MIPANNIRWEFGSEYHWMGTENNPTNVPYPWGAQGIYVSCGRDAISVLLRHGMKQRGWKRIWVPSYYCHQVLNSINGTGIIVQYYDFNPVSILDHKYFENAKTDDVILIVNYFGLTGKDQIAIDANNRFEIIEDHTHDPFSEWAFTSTADWCVSSLRKALPLPDGGVFWSPQSHALPDEMNVTAEKCEVSLRKLTAMYLKAEYLHGAQVEKDAFRELFESSESGFVSDAISGITPWSRNLLDRFPIDHWRNVRIQNYKYLVSLIEDLPGIMVVRSSSRSLVCPFSVIIVFQENAQRQFVRERLIAANVYPAILWPIIRESYIGHHPPHNDIDFSSTMLSLPCDMRYSQNDVEITAKLFSKYVIEYKNNK